MLEKDLLKEIDNNITDEELIAICSEELILERKKVNLKNFILKVKELNYKALPHFKFAKKHLSRITKFQYFKNNQQINRLIKLVSQMELAEYLLHQGATIQEIKAQTDISSELLAAVIRKNYDRIPKEILRFRLINYRILKLAKLQELFFKQTILPLVSQQDKTLALSLLSTFEDLVKMEVKERVSLEKKLNEE
jgi:hypothetical protein